MQWERTLRGCGGIASAAYLHRLGLTDVDIRMFAMYGALVSVRRGWYALRGTDATLVDACRLGGRLTCGSALRHYGEDAPDDGRLHIELRRSDVLRVPAAQRHAVRVHWKRVPSPGACGIVDVDAARRQALACGAEGKMRDAPGPDVERRRRPDTLSP